MAAGGDDKDTGQATEMGEKFGQSCYVRISNNISYHSLVMQEFKYIPFLSF